LKALIGTLSEVFDRAEKEGDKYVIYRCPKCRNLLRKDEDCEHCGIVLDWSNYQELKIITPGPLLAHNAGPGHDETKAEPRTGDKDDLRPKDQGR